MKTHAFKILIIGVCLLVLALTLFLHELMIRDRKMDNTISCVADYNPTALSMTELRYLRIYHAASRIKNLQRDSKLKMVGAILNKSKNKIIIDWFDYENKGRYVVIASKSQKIKFKIEMNDLKSNERQVGLNYHRSAVIINENKFPFDVTMPNEVFCYIEGSEEVKLSDAIHFDYIVNMVQ